MEKIPTKLFIPPIQPIPSLRWLGLLSGFWKLSPFVVLWLGIPIHKSLLDMALDTFGHMRPRQQTATRCGFTFFIFCGLLLH